MGCSQKCCLPAPPGGSLATISLSFIRFCHDDKGVERNCGVGGVSRGVGAWPGLLASSHQAERACKAGGNKQSGGVAIYFVVAAGVGGDRSVTVHVVQ